MQKGVQCAKILREISSFFYVNIDPSLNEPLKAKVTDFLMEKEVLVGKYRGLQLPDDGDGYDGDGDDDDDDNNDNDDDDDDEEEEEEDDDNVDDNDNDDGWRKKTLWRNVFNCLAIMIHIVMRVMVTMMMMMVMVMVVMHQW